MEGKAALVPCQPAVRNDAARVRLEVRDQLLVFHVQHDAFGQHAPPMDRQPLITAIVASQLAEVVGVRQVGSHEQTRETRYAGIERIASYVNELRVGQGKMNKSGKDKVRRHLVGDPFGTGRSEEHTSELQSRG